jgi:hypothetical protein
VAVVNLIGVQILQLLATLETKPFPKLLVSMVMEQLLIGARMALKTTKTNNLFNGVKKLKKKILLKLVGAENEYINVKSLKSISIKIMAVNNLELQNY